jgi:hypothetical protein
MESMKQQLKNPMLYPFELRAPNGLTNQQSSDPDNGMQDPLCWRCGQLDSQHSWFDGLTLCEPLSEDEEGKPQIDVRRTFQPYPSEMDDEELIRRMEFVRDVRDWVL